MNKYFYIDHSGDSEKIAFECEAENILEADGLFTVATGKKPEKEKYIGCLSIYPGYKLEKNQIGQFVPKKFQ